VNDEGEPSTSSINMYFSVKVSRRGDRVHRVAISWWCKGPEAVGYLVAVWRDD
jgi:hypothetical protein